MFALWISTVASAASGDLSYSGRLVNADGSPVSGPVNLRFDVVYASDPSIVLCTKTLNGVLLSQGVFHTKLGFTDGECGGTPIRQILSSVGVSDSVSIRVTDTTPLIDKAYGFQQLNSMPYAIVADFAKSLGAMGATTAGQVLRWDGSKWAPDTIDEVAAGSIGTPELADNSVTSAKIVDLTITGADIANGSISDAKLNLADGSIDQVKVAGLAASFATKEDALSITTSDNYLDGTKAWRNFEASVRSAFLTGFSSGPALPVVPGDSVLTALGKLDALIASVQAVSGSYVAHNGSVPMTGNLNLDNNKITNLATPTLGSDAATMAYVDSKATQWSLVGDDVYYTPGGVGVGVGVLEPSAIFQVTSDNKGVLISRMTEAQRNAIASPANGLMVYNTTANAINYYDGDSWEALGVAGAGAPPSGAAGGDLEGTYPNPTLKSGIAQSKITNLTTDLAAKLDDSQLDSTVTLGTDNTKIPSQGAVKSYVDSAVTGVNISTKPVGGDLSGTVGTATVIKIQGRDVVTTAPIANQVLKWNGAAWAPANDNDTIYTLPNVGTAGTYGSSTVVPVITTDAQGRVTGVVNTPITGAAPTGTAGGDLDGTYPNPTLKAGLPATRISTGLVDNTEFNYLDGVTSNIQAQLTGMLPLSGGTLTGPLILSANPTLALEAATKQYVDSGIATAASKWTNVTGGINYGAGSVGINTSIPGAKLHVAGNVYSSLLSLGRSGSHYDEIGYNLAFTGTNDTYTYRGNDYAASMRLGWQGDIEFRTATTGAAGSPLTLNNRMIIKQDGKVGIGTTSPEAQLHIGKQEAPAATAGSVDRMIIQPYGHTGGPWKIIARDTAPDAFLDFKYGSTSVLTFEDSGLIGMGVSAPGEKLDVGGNVRAVSFISTSDRNLKTNLQKVNGLNTISKLNGYQFDWKKDGSTEYGVMAQEVEKVMPHAVVTNANTNVKSVKYNSLIAPVIEAIKELFTDVKKQEKVIKEQKREIASLKEKNQELEERLKKLEDRMSDQPSKKI